MKIEDAQRRIAAFAKRFDRSHLYLAYHAALPLALTPDLLYCIWGNFTRDIHQKPLGIPWIAVSDLILSSLCDEVGDELYEMDATVRQELLKQFKDEHHFTEKRLKQVAEFLLAYVRRDLNHPDAYYRDFAESQTWAGLAYIEPTESVKLLVAAFEQASRENPADLMRLVSLTEMLYQPISEFERLLIFARAMGHYRRKRLEEAKGEVMKLTIKDGRLNIGDNIVMRMPPELLQLIAPPVDAEMQKQIIAPPVDAETQKQIDRLIKVIETTENEYTRFRAAKNLWKIDPGNPQVIAGLLEVITSSSYYTFEEAVKILGKIGQGNPQAIPGLLKIIATTQDKDTWRWSWSGIREIAIESLGEIGQGNPQAIAALRHIANTKYEDTRRKAIEILKKLESGNNQE